MSKYILSLQSSRRNRTLYQNPCEFVLPISQKNKNDTFFKDPISQYAPLKSWTSQTYVNPTLNNTLSDRTIIPITEINTQNKEMIIKKISRPNILIVHLYSQDSIQDIIQEPNYFKDKGIRIYTKDKLSTGNLNLVLDTSIMISSFLQTLSLIGGYTYSMMFIIKDSLSNDIIVGSDQLESDLYAYFYYDTNTTKGLFYVPGYNLFNRIKFILVNDTKNQSIDVKLSRETNLFYCENLNDVKLWSNDDYYSICRKKYKTFNFKINNITYPQHILYDGNQTKYHLISDYISCFNQSIKHKSSFLYRVETDNNHSFQINDIITLTKYKLQLQLIRKTPTFLWTIISDISNSDIVIGTLSYQFNGSSGSIDIQHLLIYIKDSNVFNIISENYQKGLKVFHYLPITNDNLYTMAPKTFIHSKSYLSHITLMSLVLPNLLLKTNQRLTDAYQSIYIVLYNVHQPSKAHLYINDPLHQKDITFVIPLHKIQRSDTYLHLFPSGVEITTRIDPNQDIYFKLCDIHGNVIEYNTDDTLAPYFPKPELQICAQFNVVLLE